MIQTYKKVLFNPQKEFLSCDRDVTGPVMIHTGVTRCLQSELVSEEHYSVVLIPDK